MTVESLKQKLPKLTLYFFISIIMAFVAGITAIGCGIAGSEGMECNGRILILPLELTLVLLKALGIKYYKLNIFLEVLVYAAPYFLIILVIDYLVMLSRKK